MTQRLTNNRSDVEDDALRQVEQVAETWGYGRCIQFLHYRWAQKLVDNEKFTPEAAARCALMNEHDIKMFVEGLRM